MKKLNLTILSFFIALIFISCKTTRLENEFNFSDSDWTYVEDGIEETSYRLKNLKWHCVKIDLSAAQVSPVVYPQTARVKSAKVKKIAKKNNAVIAINTTPFANIGKLQTPVGITKIKDTIVSQPVERYSALGLKTDENEIISRAALLLKQTESEIAGYDYVIGGFFSVLINGEIQEFKKFYRPRMACGTNKDGTELYFFATNAMTYEECAKIMFQLGCTDALQFDGGHSTNLVIKNQNVIKASPLRKVPSVLCITLK